jgi:hypothetical protein
MLRVFPDSSAAYGEDEVDHRAIIAADVRRFGRLINKEGVLGTRGAILSKPAMVRGLRASTAGPLLQPEYGQLVTKSQGVFGRAICLNCVRPRPPGRCRREAPISASLRS